MSDTNWAATPSPVPESEPTDPEVLVRLKHHPIRSEPRFAELQRRLNERGVGHTWYCYKDGSGEPWLVFDIMGGHEIRIDSGNVDEIQRFDFERWRGVAGYKALVNQATETIHAHLRSVARLSRDEYAQIGFALVESESVGDSRQMKLESADGKRTILLQTFDLDHELQAAFADMPTTHEYSIQISPVQPESADEAARILREIAGAFAFELDCQAGFMLQLTTQDAEGMDSTPAPTLSRRSARFPRLLYNSDILDLYVYARARVKYSFQAQPLLSYLTYYQILEFYMPVYARAELLRQFKLILKDPTLDPDDDVGVSRILGAAVDAGRDESERSQLRSTIQACVTDADLSRFLSQEGSSVEPLFSKSTIAEVRHLNSKDRSLPMIAQVAERVYDIRCRIVHAKDSASSGKPKPLFPSNPEAKRLAADILLIQFLAQRVISATGRSMRF